MTDFAFVHGGAQASWVWRETMEALRQQDLDGTIRPIAYDLAGCGAKRGRDVAGLGVRDVGAELADEIRRSGQRDIILVGHSNAGTIMPIVAESCADLLRRIVYVSCIAAAPDQSVLERMNQPHAARTVWREDATPAERTEQFRAMFCNDMAPAQAETFLAKLGEDRWPTMSAMRETGWRYDHLDAIASTYVFCLEDRVLPLAWQEEFAARLKTRRRISVDAGHQVMNTRPHALAEILRAEAIAECPSAA